jgi:hypothetical protein
MFEDTPCPDNISFHHRNVPQGTFCPGCGRKNPLITQAVVRAQSLPGPSDEVISIDDGDDLVKAKKGVYIPTSQTQVLHSMSHLPPGEEDARRAYARTVVNSSRQRSIIGRGPQQGRAPVNRNRVGSGGVATKKNFFEVQLWLVRWSVSSDNDPFNRQFLWEDSHSFRKLSYRSSRLHTYVP